MPNTKKASTTKKTASKVTPKKVVKKKSPAKKAVTKKAPTTVKVEKATVIKSLRLAQNESQSFLLISSDFDGRSRKILQIICSLILLGIFGTMVYMAFLANEIAQAVLLYT